VDRLTRKELKKDKFALEVGHTVEFLEVHRKLFIRYGAIALAVVVLLVGWFYYSRSQSAARQRELRAAMTLMEAPVGPSPAPGATTFSSAEEKNKAVTAALSDLATKRSGSDEGLVAQYYLGTAAADQGRMDEAVRRLTTVADSGSRDYASLAKLVLSQIYAGQGKTAEAEKLLRGLIDKPTLLVTKEEATIALGRLLTPTRPEEARKMLDPLQKVPGPVGRAAVLALTEMPIKK
jgi:predicted negative regulator of RcsB-dependent stress response